MMKMDLIANSRNDEYYTPRYAVIPLLKYIPSGKTIWCPFDTKESLIVKTLKEAGYIVKESHIRDGADFFYTSPLGDIAISNPPYSLKMEVFKKLFKLSIPFAMLVGVVGLFESRERFELFSKNEFEILWMSKRISYFKSFSDPKPFLNPPFSSVWITKGFLPRGNVFEEIQKGNF
jgi:hypothetical protein